MSADSSIFSVPTPNSRSWGGIGKRCTFDCHPSAASATTQWFECGCAAEHQVPGVRIGLTRLKIRVSNTAASCIRPRDTATAASYARSTSSQRQCGPNGHDVGVSF
jgi:hypothetical protein